MFSGALGLGLMIFMATRDPAATNSPHFGWIIIPSMLGLLIGQILLAVVYHLGITTEPDLERPRLVNRILFGFEITCWAGMSGFSVFTGFTVFSQMRINLATVAPTDIDLKTMMGAALLQTHSVASFVGVFVGLIMIVNALMTPNLARLRRRP